VSLFENAKYDVLKFDVENPVLAEINTELSKLPHTTNFPDYHPHATIGYLKPGTGKKYVDLFNGDRHDVSAHKIVYSKPDDSRIEEEWN
jgi:2'-5' RNA ligase